MAGIGIRLAKLLDRETFTSDLTASGSAAAVFTGPWLLGALALFLVYLDARLTLSARDMLLLFTILTYTYVGAMLIAGPLGPAVTRRLADFLYDARLEAIGPTFVTTWMVVTVTSCAAGVLFNLADDLPLSLAAISTLLVTATALVWICGIFATALRSFVPLVLVFLGGYALSVVAGIGLGRLAGLRGYLLGFWIGLAFLATALTGMLARAFPPPRTLVPHLVREMLSYPAYLLVGFTFCLGVWIDKLLVWYFAPWSLHVTHLIRAAPFYDLACTVGLLSVVPGTAWLLLRAEGFFAGNARRFYTAIQTHEPLGRVQATKREMVLGLKEGFWELVQFQLPVTLALLYLAPWIARTLELPALAVSAIRFQVLACYPLVLIQVQVLYLFYFDQPRLALASTATLLAANAGLTWLTLTSGPLLIGAGTLGANLLAAAVGGLCLDRAFADLEYRAIARYARISLHEENLTDRQRGDEPCVPLDSNAMSPYPATRSLSSPAVPATS